MCGLPSHSWTSPPRPTRFITSSAKPPGWSMSSQMTAVIASETTYGAKMSSRITACPCSRRLSSIARPMLSGSWIATESTAMITLCRIELRKTGSLIADA